MSERRTCWTLGVYRRQRSSVNGVQPAPVQASTVERATLERATHEAAPYCFNALSILVIISLQFKKYILVEYRKVRKFNSMITGAYNENITGVRISKALAREDANLNEFSGLSNNMYRILYCLSI